MTNLKAITIDSENTYFSTQDGVLFKDSMSTLAAYPADKEDESYTVPVGVTTLLLNSISYNKHLKTLNTGDTTENINSYAVRDCESLSTLIIGSKTSVIAEGAFYNSVNLTSLSFYAKDTFVPENSQNVNNNVFYNAGTNSTGINVMIGATVNTIPSNLFNPTYNSAEGSPNIVSVVFESESTCSTIEVGAFSYLTTLKQIELPQSLSYINHYAFKHCTGLEKFVTNGNIFEISKEAFYNCNKLEAITFSGNVDFIGEYAFYDCTSLTTLSVPTGSTEISTYSFAGCTNLQTFAVNAIENLPVHSFDDCVSLKNFTSLNAPSFNSTLTIEEAVFKNCRNLETFTVNDGIDIIKASAFERCSSLTSVNLSVLQKISSNAFYGCTSLNTLNITGSLTEIEAYAFGGCSTLTQFIFPEQIKTIGSYAFMNCTSLSEISVPQSVELIGASAFSGCNSLNKITLPFIGAGKTTHTDENTRLSYIFNAAESGYVVPTSLKTVIILSDTIYSHSFSGCSSLTTVDISNVTVIPSNAFSGCTSLTNYIFNPNITSIKSNAFKDCSFTTFEIPESLQTLASDAFEGCALESISVNENNAIYASENGILYNKLKTELLLYPAYKQGESFTISSSVQTVKENAFSNSKYLTSVTASTVEFVNSEAFYSCTKLESVTFQDTLTTLSDYSFSNCTKLQSVTLPDTLERISDYAFMYCSSLTEFSIPKNLTIFGVYVFTGCTSLTKIQVDEDNTDYFSVDGVLYENKGTGVSLACYPAGKPDEVFTTDSRTKFINYNSFMGAKYLTKVIITNNVTTIGAGAFRNCSKLSSVYISKSVTAIGGYAFEGTSLSEVLYAGSKQEFNESFAGNELNINPEINNAQKIYNASL